MIRFLIKKFGIFKKTILSPPEIFSNLKKIILSSPERLRLKAMYKVETDKAVYIAYNTETIKCDAVNIEIEETRDCKKKLILEKDLMDDSWGGLAGDSFFSLSVDSKNHLNNYIKSNKEVIISAFDYILKENFWQSEPSIYTMPDLKWIESKECPDCKSTNIKWHLSSTKQCKDCDNVFRAENLV